MLSYYEFYLDNKFDLQNLIELTDADIFTYRQVMNKLFSNNTLMFVYINDFNNNYENSDNLIIQKIIKVFNKVLVNQEKILEIDEHMSFASRVVVVEDYNKWFVSKEWLNRPLVNSYFIDELLSINSEVQSLYKEMLFVYLIPEYSFEEKIDNEDIDTFIENLNTLVDQKILYYRDVNNILKILFIDNMFINRMVENELISLDTVQYAKGLIV